MARSVLSSFYTNGAGQLEPEAVTAQPRNHLSYDVTHRDNPVARRSPILPPRCPFATRCGCGHGPASARRRATKNKKLSVPTPPRVGEWPAARGAHRNRCRSILS